MPLLTPHVPNGLIDLMKDLAKEVLRDKPENLYEFAAVHFEKQLQQRDGSLDKNYEQFTAFENFFDGQQRFAIPSNTGYICQRPIKIQPIWQPKMSKADVMASFKAMESIHEEDVLMENPYADEKYENAIYIIQRYYRRYAAKKKIPPSPALSEVTAAIIIQRTMRRLFSNKIKLKTEGGADHPVKQQHNGLAQDDVDNVSEAASYTSSSTIQLLADSQEGRENRSSGRREVILDGGADDDDDGSTGSGFKEQTTTTTTTTATQDVEELLKPPSEEETSEEPPNEQPPVAEPEAKVEHNSELEAGATEVEEKSIADENGKSEELHKEETTLEHPTKALDVNAGKSIAWFGFSKNDFHKQDTSTAHIGIFPTKIGSYGQQNSIHTDTVELDSNSSVPTQTKHHVVADKSFPLSYPQSLGATPDTLPATSPQPFGASEGTFAVRLQGNAYAQSDTAYPYEPPVQMRKFDPDTGEYFKVHDVFYQDKDDPDFSDSLNESTMEKDSLENEDLDVDSLESSEYVTHVSGIVKREVKPDEDSLNGDVNEVEQEEGAKSVELERGPTYLYGIHPSRTPVMERKSSRNKNLSENKKVRSETDLGVAFKSLTTEDGISRDKSEEELSLESKDSTSDESGVTQIENVVDKHEEAIIESEDGKKLPDDIDVEDMKTEKDSIQIEPTPSEGDTGPEHESSESKVSKFELGKVLLDKGQPEKVLHHKIESIPEIKAKPAPDSKPGSQDGTEDVSDSEKSSKGGSSDSSRKQSKGKTDQKPGTQILDAGALLIAAERIARDEAFLKARGSGKDSWMSDTSTIPDTHRHKRSLHEDDLPSPKVTSIDEKVLVAKIKDSPETLSENKKTSYLDSSIVKDMNEKRPKHEEHTTAVAPSNGTSSSLKVTAPKSPRPHSTLDDFTALYGSYDLNRPASPLPEPHEEEVELQPKEVQSLMHFYPGLNVRDIVSEFHPQDSQHSDDRRMGILEHDSTTNADGIEMKKHTQDREQPHSGSETKFSKIYEGDIKARNEEGIVTKDEQRTSTDESDVEKDIPISIVRVTPSEAIKDSSTLPENIRSSQEEVKRDKIISDTRNNASAEVKNPRSTKTLSAITDGEKRDILDGKESDSSSKIRSSKPTERAEHDPKHPQKILSSSSTSDSLLLRSSSSRKDSEEFVDTTTKLEPEKAIYADLKSRHEHNVRTDAADTELKIADQLREGASTSGKEDTERSDKTLDKDTDIFDNTEVTFVPGSQSEPVETSVTKDYQLDSLSKETVSEIKSKTLTIIKEQEVLSNIVSDIQQGSQSLSKDGKSLTSELTTSISDLIDAGHTQMDDNQATPSLQTTTREQLKLLKGETVSERHDFTDSIHKDTYDMSKEQLTHMTSVQDGSLKDSAETSLSKIDTEDVSLKITKKSDESKDSDVTGDSKKEESETVEIVLKDLDPQQEGEIGKLEDKMKPRIGELKDVVHAREIIDQRSETQKKALEVSLGKDSEDASDVAGVSKIVVSKDPTSTTAETTLKALDPKLEKEIEKLEEEVTPVIREQNYAVSPAEKAKQSTDPEPETQNKALEVSLDKEREDDSGVGKVSKVSKKELSKDPTSTEAEITPKDLDPKLEKEIEKLEEEVTTVIRELNYAVSPAEKAKQSTDPEPETQKKVFQVSLSKDSEDASDVAGVSKIVVSKEPTSTTAEATLKALDPKLEKEIEKLEEEVTPVIRELNYAVSPAEKAKQSTDPEPETQNKALEVSLDKEREDDSGVGKVSKVSKKELSKDPTSTEAEITPKDLDPKLEKEIEKLEEEVTTVIRELNYAVSPAEKAKQSTDPEPETQKKVFQVSLSKDSEDASDVAGVSKIVVSKEPTSTTAEATLKALDPKLEKEIEKLEEEVTPVIRELNYAVSPVEKAKQITDPEPETQKKALEVSLDREDDSGIGKVSKVSKKEVSKDPTSTEPEITLKDLDPKLEKKIEKLEEEVTPVIGELNYAVSPAEKAKQSTDPEPETQKKALEVSLDKEREDDSGVGKVSKVSKKEVSKDPTSTEAEITLKDLDPKLEKEIEKLEEEVTPVIGELNYAVSPGDNAKQSSDPEPETQKKVLEVSLDREDDSGVGKVSKVSKKEVSKDPTSTEAEITLKDLNPKLEKEIEKLEEEVTPVIGELNYAVSPAEKAKQSTDPEPETQKKALEVSLGKDSEDASDVAGVSKIVVSKEPTSPTTLKALDPNLEKKIEKVEEEVKPMIVKLKDTVASVVDGRESTDPEPETQKKILEVSLDKESEDDSGVTEVSKIEVSKEPTATEIIPKIVDSKLEETLDNSFREEFKSEIGELKSKSVKDAVEITDQEPETKLKILEVSVDKESDSKEVVREEPSVKSHGPIKSVEKLHNADELSLNQPHLVLKREIRTESTLLAGHQATVDRDNMPKDKTNGANIDSDQLGSIRPILEQRSPAVKMAKDQDKSKESSDCKTGQQRALDAAETSSSVIVKQETDTAKISEEGDNTSVDLRPKGSRSDVKVEDKGAVETEIITKDSAYVEDKILPVDGVSKGFDKSNLPTHEVHVKSSHRDESIVAKNIITAVASEVVKKEGKDIDLSVGEEIVPKHLERQDPKVYRKENVVETEAQDKEDEEISKITSAETSEQLLAKQSEPHPKERSPSPSIFEESSLKDALKSYKKSPIYRRRHKRNTLVGDESELTEDSDDKSDSMEQFKGESYDSKSPNDPASPNVTEALSLTDALKSYKKNSQFQRRTDHESSKNMEYGSDDSKSPTDLTSPSATEELSLTDALKTFKKSIPQFHKHFDHTDLNETKSQNVESDDDKPLVVEGVELETLGSKINTDTHQKWSPIEYKYRPVHKHHVEETDHENEVTEEFEKNRALQDSGTMPAMIHDKVELETEDERKVQTEIKSEDIKKPQIQSDAPEPVVTKTRSEKLATDPKVQENASSKPEARKQDSTEERDIDLLSDEKSKLKKLEVDEGEQSGMESILTKESTEETVSEQKISKLEVSELKSKIVKQENDETEKQIKTDMAEQSAVSGEQSNEAFATKQPKLPEAQNPMESVVKNKNIESALSEDQPVKTPTKDDPIRLKESWNKNMINDFIQAERLSYVSPVNVKSIETEDPSNSLASSGTTEVTNCDESNTSADFSSIGKDLDFLEDTIHYLKSATAHLSHSISDDTKAEIRKTESAEDSKRSKRSTLESDSEITPTWNAADQDHFGKEAASAVEGIYRKVPEESTKKSAETSDTIGQEKFKAPMKSSEEKKTPDAIRPIVEVQLAEDLVDKEDNFDHIEESKISKVEHKESESGQIKSYNDEADQKKDLKVEDIKQHDPQIPTMLPSQKSKTKDQDPTVSPPSRPATLPSRIRREKPLDEKKVKAVKSKSLDEAEQSKSKAKAKPVKFDRSYKAASLTDQQNEIEIKGKSVQTATSKVQPSAEKAKPDEKRAAPRPVETEIQLADDKKEKKLIKSKAPSTSDLLGRQRSSKTKRDRFGKKGRSMSTNEQGQIQTGFDLEAIKKELLTKKVKTPPQSGKKAKISARNGRQKRAIAIEEEIHKESQDIVSKSQSDILQKDDHQADDQLRHKGVRPKASESEEQEKELTKIETQKKSPHASNSFEGRDEEIHVRSSTESEIEKPASKTTKTKESERDSPDFFDNLKEDASQLKDFILQSSATMIQKVFRGYKTRKDLTPSQVDTSDIPEDLKNATIHKEAKQIEPKISEPLFAQKPQVKLQDSMDTDKSFDKILTEAKTETPEIEKAGLDTFEKNVERISDADLDKSALVIQKAYTDYKTRKNLKKDLVKPKDFQRGAEDISDMKRSEIRIVDENENINLLEQEVKTDKKDDQKQTDEPIVMKTTQKSLTEDHFDQESPNFGLLESLKKEVETLKETVLQKSATIIQKTFRGYKARKDLKDQKSDRIQKDINPTDDSSDGSQRVKISDNVGIDQIDKTSRYEMKTSQKDSSTKDNPKEDSQKMDENPDETQFGPHLTIFDNVKNDVEIFKKNALDKSATTIQKTFRGYKARKNLENNQITSKLRDDISAVSADAPVPVIKPEKEAYSKENEKLALHSEEDDLRMHKQESKEKEIDISALNIGNVLDKSATTIQKHFRGYQTRKNIGKNINKISTTQMPEKEYEDVKFTSKVLPKTTSQIFESDKKGDTKMDTERRIEKRKQKDIDLTHTSDSSGNVAQTTKTADQVSSREKELRAEKSSKAMINESILKDALDRSDVRSGTAGILRRSKGSLQLNKEFEEYNAHKAMKQQEFKSKNVEERAEMPDDKIEGFELDSPDQVVKTKEKDLAHPPTELESTHSLESDQIYEDTETISGCTTKANSSESIKTVLDASEQRQKQAVKTEQAQSQEPIPESPPISVPEEYKVRAISADAFLDKAASTIQKAYRYYYSRDRKSSVSPKASQRSYSQGAERKLAFKESSESSYESSNFIGPDTSFDLSDVDSTETKSEKVSNIKERVSSEASTLVNDNDRLDDLELEIPDSPPMGISIHPEMHEPEKVSTNGNSLLVPETIRRKRSIMEPTAPPLQDILDADETLASDNKPQWYVGDELIVPTDPDETILPTSSSSSSILNPLSSSSSIDKLSSVDARNENLQLTPSINSAVVSTSSLLLTNDTQMHHPDTLKHINKPFRAVSATEEDAQAEVVTKVNKEDSIKEEKSKELNKNEEETEKEEPKQDTTQDDIVPLAGLETNLEIPRTDPFSPRSASDDANEKNEEEISSELCKNCAIGFHVGCCPNTWTEDTPAEQELSKVTQSQVANAKTEKDDTDASMATEKHFDEIKQFVLMETTSSAADDSTDEATTKDGDKDNTETTDMKDDFKEQRQGEADDNKVSAVDEPITSVVTVIVSQAEEPSTSPKGLPTISLIPPSSEEDTSDSTIEQESNYKTSVEKGRKDIEQEKTTEDSSTEVDGKSEENLRKVSDAKDHNAGVELPTNEVTEVVDVVQLDDTRSCSKTTAATSDEEKGQIKAGSIDEIGSDKTELSTHTSEDVKANGDAKIEAKTSKGAPSEDSVTDGDVTMHETVTDGDIPDEKVVEKTKMSSEESGTSAKSAADENDKEMKAKELSKDSSSSSASLKKDSDAKCKEDDDERVEVNGKTIDATEEPIVPVKTQSLETSPTHTQSSDEHVSLTNDKGSAEIKTVVHRVKSESQDSDSKKSKEIDDQHSADFSSDADSELVPKVEGSSSFELKSKSVKSEEESKPGEGKAKGPQTSADADNSEELSNQKTEEQIIGKEKMDASERTKESKEITLKLGEDQVSGTNIQSSKDLEPEKPHSKSTEESKKQVSEADKAALDGEIEEKSQEVKLKRDSENAKNDNEKQPQSSDVAEKALIEKNTEKPLTGENNKNVPQTTASSEEKSAVHQTEKKHSVLQRSKTVSTEEQDKQAREDFEIAAKLLDVLKHDDSKSILEENKTTDASKDDTKEVSSTDLNQLANKQTSDAKLSLQLDPQIEANLERLIEESQPHIEAKEKSVEPQDLPKKDSSIEVIETPCTKMIVPRTFDEEESELESTTPMAESSDTSNDYDNVSDTDAIETTLSIPDTLEAMTEKLGQAEATVARMQKRRASEHTSSIENIDPSLAFGEPICDPIKPMRELQKSSSLEIEDDIVLRKLQRDDTTRESSAQSESVVFGDDSASQLTESEDTFNESLDFQTLKRMNTIAADRSTFKPPNPLLKSVTIDDTVKYIDPEKSTEESGSSFSMDDAISADVRKKMMAYSVSEADSDYYEEGLDHTNRPHDDFNISTALDTFPSSDTDTTIVSAATKIQAGARGFLTRRRLRRASMGTKSSLTDTKTSFGNDAIGESLERLVEEEVTKRLPKAQYHRQVGVNSLPSVLRNSDETKSALLSPTHEETTHIDDDSDELKLAELTSASSTTTLTGGEWASIDGQKDKYNLSTSSENDVNGLLEPEDESAQVSPNLEATLAARRLTLQRGDAMRNDSTPDDDNSNGKQNSAKNIPTSSNRATGTDTVLIHQAATVESMTSTTTERKNYSDAATSARMEKIKWFAMRQNSMPVQIDSEVFRVLPKHMRKRIKSAEGEMKRRIRLPRD